MPPNKLKMVVGLLVSWTVLGLDPRRLTAVDAMTKISTNNSNDKRNVEHGRAYGCPKPYDILSQKILPVDCGSTLNCFVEMIFSDGTNCSSHTRARAQNM
jgi:hypothetical protein